MACRLIAVDEEDDNGFSVNNIAFNAEDDALKHPEDYVVFKGKLYAVEASVYRRSYEAVKNMWVKVKNEKAFLQPVIDFNKETKEIQERSKKEQEDNSDFANTLRENVRLRKASPSDKSGNILDANGKGTMLYYDKLGNVVRRSINITSRIGRFFGNKRYTEEKEEPTTAESLKNKNFDVHADAQAHPSDYIIGNDGELYAINNMPQRRSMGMLKSFIDSNGKDTGLFIGEDGNIYSYTKNSIYQMEGVDRETASKDIEIPILGNVEDVFSLHSDGLYYKNREKPKVYHEDKVSADMGKPQWWHHDANGNTDSIKEGVGQKQQQEKQEEKKDVGHTQAVKDSLRASEEARHLWRELAQLFRMDILTDNKFQYFQRHIEGLKKAMQETQKLIDKGVDVENNKMQLNYLGSLYNDSILIQDVFNKAYHNHNGNFRGAVRQGERLFVALKAMDEAKAIKELIDSHAKSAAEGKAEAMKRYTDVITPEMNAAVEAYNKANNTHIPTLKDGNPQVDSVKEEHTRRYNEQRYHTAMKTMSIELARDKEDTPSKEMAEMDGRYLLRMLKDKDEIGTIYKLMSKEALPALKFDINKRYEELRHNKITTHSFYGPIEQQHTDSIIKESSPIHVKTNREGIDRVHRRLIYLTEAMLSYVQLLRMRVPGGSVSFTRFITEMMRTADLSLLESRLPILAKHWTQLFDEAVSPAELQNVADMVRGKIDLKEAQEKHIEKKPNIEDNKDDNHVGEAKAIYIGVAYKEIERKDGRRQKKFVLNGDNPDNPIDNNILYDPNDIKVGTELKLQVAQDYKNITVKDGEGGYVSYGYYMEMNGIKEGDDKWVATVPVVAVSGGKQIFFLGQVGSSQGYVEDSDKTLLGMRRAALVEGRGDIVITHREPGTNASIRKDRDGNVVTDSEGKPVLVYAAALMSEHPFPMLKAAQGVDNVYFAKTGRSEILEGTKDPIVSKRADKVVNAGKDRQEDAGWFQYREVGDGVHLLRYRMHIPDGVFNPIKIKRDFRGNDISRMNPLTHNIVRRLILAITVYNAQRNGNTQLIQHIADKYGGELWEHAHDAEVLVKRAEQYISYIVKYNGFKIGDDSSLTNLLNMFVSLYSEEKAMDINESIYNVMYVRGNKVNIRDFREQGGPTITVDLSNGDIAALDTLLSDRGPLWNVPSNINPRFIDNKPVASDKEDKRGARMRVFIGAEREMEGLRVYKDYVAHITHSNVLSIKTQRRDGTDMVVTDIRPDIRFKLKHEVSGEVSVTPAVKPQLLLPPPASKEKIDQINGVKTITPTTPPNSNNTNNKTLQHHAKILKKIQQEVQDREGMDPIEGKGWYDHVLEVAKTDIEKAKKMIALMSHKRNNSLFGKVRKYYGFKMFKKVFNRFYITGVSNVGVSAFATSVYNDILANLSDAKSLSDKAMNKLIEDTIDKLTNESEALLDELEKAEGKDGNKEVLAFILFRRNALAALRSNKQIFTGKNTMRRGLVKMKLQSFVKNIKDDRVSNIYDNDNFKVSDLFNLSTLRFAHLIPRKDSAGGTIYDEMGNIVYHDIDSVLRRLLYVMDGGVNSKQELLQKLRTMAAKEASFLDIAQNLERTSDHTINRLIYMFSIYRNKIYTVYKGKKNGVMNANSSAFKQVKYGRWHLAIYNSIISISHTGKVTINHDRVRRLDKLRIEALMSSNVVLRYVKKRLDHLKNTADPKMDRLELIKSVVKEKPEAIAYLANTNSRYVSKLIDAIKENARPLVPAPHFEVSLRVLNLDNNEVNAAIGALTRGDIRTMQIIVKKGYENNGGMLEKAAAFKEDGGPNFDTEKIYNFFRSLNMDIDLATVEGFFNKKMNEEQTLRAIHMLGYLINVNPETAKDGYSFFLPMFRELMSLIDEHAKHTNLMADRSFSVNGKTIQGYSKTTAIRDTLNDIKDSSNPLVDTLLSIPYYGNNVVLQMARELPSIREQIDIGQFSPTALVSQRNNPFQERVTEQGLIDYYYIELSLFTEMQERREFTHDGHSYRMAQMTHTTISDKSNLPIHTMPVLVVNHKNFSLTEEDDGTETIKLGRPLLDLLSRQLFQSELRRVINVRRNSATMRFKNMSSNGKYFFNHPRFNTLQVDGADIHTFIENFKGSEEEMANIIIAATEAQVHKIITDTVVKEYSDIKSVFDKYQKFLLPALNQRYLDSTVHDAGGPVANAIMDYAVNKIFSTANIVQIYNGDFAMYKGDITKFQKDGNTNWGAFVKAVYEDVVKRSALLTAPRSRLSDVVGDSYHQIYVSDPVSTADHLAYRAGLYYNVSDEDRRDLQHLEMVTAQLERATDAEAIERLTNERNTLLGKLSKKFPIIADYFTVESTDAQEFVTWREAFNIIVGKGSIDNRTAQRLQAIYMKLSRGEVLTEEDRKVFMDNYNATLSPHKPVYTGRQIELGEDGHPMYANIIYNKTMATPLLPQYTAGTRLDRVRQVMEELENRTDIPTRLTFKTGTKADSLRKMLTIAELTEHTFDQLYDSGRLMEGTLRLDRRYFGIQIETPSHMVEDIVDNGNGTTVANITQLFQRVFGGGLSSNRTDIMFDIKVPPYLLDRYKEIYGESLHVKDGKVSGQQLYKLFYTTYDIMVEHKHDNLLRDLQFSSDNPDAFFKNIIERVIAGLETGKMSANDLNQLEVLLKDGVPDTAMPMLYSSNLMAIMQAAFNIINKEVMNLRVPGDSFYVVSSVAMDSFDKTAQSGIVFTSEHAIGSLQDSHVDEQGNFVGAGVYLPMIFTKPIVDKDGKVIGKEVIDLRDDKYSYVNDKGYRVLRSGVIDDALLEHVATRIPASGRNSTTFNRVVGFLPPEFGNVIVVPGAHTKQIGEDNDGDKRNVYLKHYGLDEHGNIRLYENLPHIQDSSVDELSREQRNKLAENMHIAIYESIFSNPHAEIQQQVKLPLNLETIQPTIDFLRSLKAEEEVLFFSATYQHSRMNSGNNGKTGVAMYSVGMSQQAILERMAEENQGKLLYVTDMREMGNIKFPGKVGMVHAVGKNGRLISTILSDHVNASVDDMKLGVMEPMNNNVHTMHAYLAMIQLGIDQETASDGVSYNYPMLFMSQDVIRQFVMERNNMQIPETPEQTAERILEKQLSLSKLDLRDLLRSDAATGISGEEAIAGDIKSLTIDMLMNLHKNDKAISAEQRARLEVAIMIRFLKFSKLGKELSNSMAITRSHDSIGYDMASYMGTLLKAYVSYDKKTLRAIGYADKKDGGTDLIPRDLTNTGMLGYYILQSLNPRSAEGVLIAAGFNIARKFIDVLFPNVHNIAKEALKRVGTDKSIYNSEHFIRQYVSEFQQFVAASAFGRTFDEVERSKNFIFGHLDGGVSFAQYINAIRSTHSIFTTNKLLASLDVKAYRGKLDIKLTDTFFADNADSINDAFAELANDNETELPPYRGVKMTPRHLALALTMSAYLSNNSRNYGSNALRKAITSDFLNDLGLNKFFDMMNDEDFIDKANEAYRQQFFMHNPTQAVPLNISTFDIVDIEDLFDTNAHDDINLGLLASIGSEQKRFLYTLNAFTVSEDVDDFQMKMALKRGAVNIYADGDTSSLYVLTGKDSDGKYHFIRVPDMSQSSHTAYNMYIDLKDDKIAYNNEYNSLPEAATIGLTDVTGGILDGAIPDDVAMAETVDEILGKDSMKAVLSAEQIRAQQQVKVATPAIVNVDDASSAIDGEGIVPSQDIDSDIAGATEMFFDNDPFADKDNIDDNPNKCG